VLIPQSIEERYQRDQTLITKQAQLSETVEKRTRQEVKQFKADQQLRRYAMDPKLRQEIVDFLINTPFFRSEHVRTAMLLAAGLDEIIPQIDLCGSTTEFVPLLTKRLEQHGILLDKEFALIRLLEAVGGQLGVNRQATIQKFCDRIRTQDRQSAASVQDRHIHLLHLSDLHLENETQAHVYRMQLETDLIQELELTHLDYIIISGDLTNCAMVEEYRAAFGFLDGLVKRFGLNAGCVVVVPGNHDLNWDASEEAYQFIPKRKLPAALPKGEYIPAGESGALLRDDTLYQQRFANFNAEFYKRIYAGVQEYPMDAAQQAQFVERPEDQLLFLGLNSCWEIDHHFTSRASINMPALTHALDHLQEGKYDGWFKIAVWHHPVTGKEMINNEFMQLLSIHGFQICLHGHIHEAIDSFHKYDETRGLHIIGAGTFGAPTKEQVPGIPLQYNLLVFDPQTGKMVVNTRKKEKPDGAWSADARWGSKKDPKAWYNFQVPNYY
jgi:predicted MPP superfamily phosphohydrolase